MCDGDNYLEKSKVRNFENMVMERGMNNIVSAFKKIAVNELKTIFLIRICGTGFLSAVFTMNCAL